jgi:hypothetical protein
VPIIEKLFIGGDHNEHVGFTRVDFDVVHEDFGYGSRNQEDEVVLNSALAWVKINTLSFPLWPLFLLFALFSQPRFIPISEPYV